MVGSFRYCWNKPASVPNATFLFVQHPSSSMARETIGWSGEMLWPGYETIFRKWMLHESDTRFICGTSDLLPVVSTKSM